MQSMPLRAMNKIKTTLIVSTYNRPDALSACLDSVRRQTLLPDEVVIGDDGSGEQTRQTIDAIRKDFPVPIVHIWHEDDGFRLAQMRNKSVASAKGDYIIEIDGDVVMHPRFIQDHMRLAKKGHYAKGGRVNLGKELSEEICRSGISRRLYAWSKGIEGKRENGVRLKALSLYLAPRYRRQASPALGCNMSFWKEDFVAVNGYDEGYVGWGCEDHDFARRLQRSGVKKRYLKFAGIVYHLWHEDKYNYNVENNRKREREQNDKQVVRCETGVDQYL